MEVQRPVSLFGTMAFFFRRGSFYTFHASCWKGIPLLVGVFLFHRRPNGKTSPPPPPPPPPSQSFLPILVGRSFHRRQPRPRFLPIGALLLFPPSGASRRGGRRRSRSRGCHAAAQAPAFFNSTSDAQDPRHVEKPKEPCWTLQLWKLRHGSVSVFVFVFSDQASVVGLSVCPIFRPNFGFGFPKAVPDPTPAGCRSSTMATAA